MPKNTIWTTLFLTKLQHPLSYRCCFVSVGLATVKKSLESGWDRAEKKERIKKLGSESPFLLGGLFVVLSS